MSPKLIASSYLLCPPGELYGVPGGVIEEDLVHPRVELGRPHLETVEYINKLS